MATVDPLFAELDGWMASLLRGITPAARRKMAREIARGLRERQQLRIRKQQAPDGSQWPQRKKRVTRTQGGMRFLWRAPSGRLQVRELLRWKNEGTKAANNQKITGYDPVRDSIRSFLRQDIDRYISIDLTQKTTATTRSQKMFRRLSTRAFLRAYNASDTAVVAFSGRVADIASVHQYGEKSQVSPGVEVRYPVREILGIADSDFDWLGDEVLRLVSQRQ